MTSAEQPFDQLYDRHFEAIFRYVLRRVANVAEAEDLTAQTFYKALRRFWRFRWTGGNASAWLYRIATNEVNMKQQTDRLHREHPGDHEFGEDMHFEIKVKETRRGGE